MKKVLFVCAMKVEADVIKKGIENKIFENFNASVLQTNIGMLNSLINTITELNNYDLIVNFGTCGASNKYYQGDIVKIDEFYNASFSQDITDCPKYNPCNIVYDTVNNKNAVALFSGDIFSTEKHSEYNNHINRDFYLFDMEAYSIKALCNKFNKNFISIKIISDNLSSTSNEDFSSFLVKMTDDSLNICKKILELLSQ